MRVANKAKAKDLPLLVLTWSRKREKTFLKSNISFVDKKSTISTNIFRKKSQKTSVGIGNFYVNDYS